jgi:nucleoside-diphosphate-sugar epimerase
MANCCFPIYNIYRGLMMNSDDRLHVVLGATGGLGSAVVQALVEQDKRVRAVFRTLNKGINFGNQVEVVRADVADPYQVSAICEGASVIYHCTNAPYTEWINVLPPMMAGVIAGAEASGARVVYGDNLYMYGQVSGLIIPDLSNKATGHKGMLRAKLATDLMKAHHSGRIRATIGRASDFFGPRVLNSSMGEVVFKALIKGQTINLIGRLDVPHTYTFVEDFARGLVMLGEREEALGEIWHIPSAETVTTQQFLDLISAEAKQKSKIRVASPLMLSLLGRFRPLLYELKEVSYEFEHPFVVDHFKYKQVFGIQTTPHREAIQKTLAWFREHYS